MSHPRAKSQVWLHFTDVNSEKKVQCLYCPQVLSVTNKSTYSLIRHLTKKHPFILLGKQPDACCMDLEPLTPDSDDTCIGCEIEELLDFAEDNEAVVDPENKAVVPRTRRLHTIYVTKPEKHVITSISEAKKHINEALLSMKSLTIKRQLEELDEYDHFAHMIAVKIRKIQDTEERETVMNSIHNVVYQALKHNI